MKKPEARSVAPSAANGHPPNLVDEDIFTFILNHEVHKATRLQYCFSLLCLSPDLAGRASPSLMKRLAEIATRQLRALDLGASFLPACVALLLIDAEPRNLSGILDRVNTALEGFPIRSGGAPWRLTLSGGGGCYPKTAVNGQELVRQAQDLMLRAKQDGGNRLYLPS